MSPVDGASLDPDKGQGTLKRRQNFRKMLIKKGRFQRSLGTEGDLYDLESESESIDTRELGVRHGE